MKDATFLVTAADEESAVLQDVTDSQVHTLSSNPGVEVGEVLVASIEPEPPLEVAWEVVDITDQRTIPVERSPEPPTQQAHEIAADQPVGEVTRRERAGDGELHILTVPEGDADDAAADVLDDEETLARAARLGVERVEVRADGQALSVRYLPD
ncbi:DUF5812 family protein [Halorientalis sp.]|uniref:DUF5812 family protein n=1 Tax=Halorientalis sp. TaxID=1931229 RepID=UPI0026317892|nr:DUF5812 family protein [Halorientalis sp.]